jgi:hypothetical protein
VLRTLNQLTKSTRVSVKNGGRGAGFLCARGPNLGLRPRSVDSFSFSFC